jgi:two-component system, OmpR family, response regulator ResD
MTMRALVCDDDRPIRVMVKDILESLGVEVIEAEDGQRALSVFIQEKLDLVVIDFLMPKIDGLQVIREMRASAHQGSVPVILMSAISKSQILENQKGFGPDYYINKPFKPGKMAKLIGAVLQRLKVGV